MSTTASASATPAILGGTPAVNLPQDDAHRWPIITADDAIRLVVLMPNPALTYNALGDVNGDGTVDVLDLLTLLGDWGPCPSCASDLNGDGTVNVLDLLDLLANWG